MQNKVNLMGCFKTGRGWQRMERRYAAVTTNLTPITISAYVDAVVYQRFNYSLMLNRAD